MSGGILGLFSPQGEGGGLLGNLHNSVVENGDSMMGLGLGLMSGDMSTAMQGFSAGNKTDTLRRQHKLLQDQELQKNTAAKALAQKYNLPPELATDADTVFGAVKAIEMQKRTPKEVSVEQQQWGMLSPEQRQQAAQNKYVNGGTEYGVSPVYGTDAQGNTSLLQLGKNGSARQTPLPQGFSISRDPIKVEGPTGTTILDPQTRQQVGFIPKDVAGAAAQQEIGKARGTATAELPKVRQQAAQMLKTVESIESDPNLSWGTGKTSFTTSIPGTGTYDFGRKVAQLQGQSFLQAFQSLKGGGQITEVEGTKAENAIARLSTSQTEAGFREALKDLKDVISVGIERANQSAGQGGSSLPPAPGSNPNRMKFDASGNPTR